MLHDKHRKLEDIQGLDKETFADSLNQSLGQSPDGEFIMAHDKPGIALNALTMMGLSRTKNLKSVMYWV